MIIEHLSSAQEAEERAYQLLLLDSEDSPNVECTKRKLDLPYGNYILSIFNNKNRSQALLRVSPMEEINGKSTTLTELLYISPSDMVIYPFRTIDPYGLAFAYLFKGLRSPFVKPTKPLTPEEALTYEGEKFLRSYFGEGKEWEDDLSYLERVQRGEEDLWQEWVNDNGEVVETTVAVSLYPSMISKITGRTISKDKDLIEAISQICGRTLSDEERKALSKTVSFYNTELFLHYATYCFLLSERYSDLQEALSQYQKFGLPKNWERSGDTIMEKGETAEEHIISNYYDKETYKLLSPVSLSEIAEATGIPISLLLQCSSSSFIKRRVKFRYKGSNK